MKKKEPGSYNEQESKSDVKQEHSSDDIHESTSNEEIRTCSCAQICKMLFKTHGSEKKKRIPDDKRLCSYRTPIEPESLFKKNWDIVISIVIIYLLFSSPFVLSFYSGTSDPTREKINSIIDILFMIDIPLTFLTSTEDSEGCLVDDPLIVTRIYIQSGWFFIDVISVIPPALLGGIRLFKLVKLFRAARLLRLLPMLQANFELKNAHVAIFKYLLLILTVAHITASNWYLVHKLNPSMISSWVYSYQDGGAAGPENFIREKYVTSLYWSITMMSTIGFGDITPGNKNEVVVAILSMVFGAGVFAYSVTNMCSVLFGMDVEGAKFHGLQDRMKHLLSNREVHVKIRKNVRKYLLYKYHVSSVVMFGGFNVLDHLSPDLKGDVLQSFCTEMFQTVDILHLFGHHFFRMISYNMQVQVFGDGESILLAGTFCDRLFILAQGEVEMLAGLSENIEEKVEKKDCETKNTEDKEKTPQTETDETIWGNCSSIKAKLVFRLNGGCSFNEVACLLGRPSTLTVFSNRFCDVYSLTRCAYLSIVKQLYPKDMPKLFKKLLNYSKNIGDLDFSLNLNKNEDETIEPSPNENPKGETDKIFEEPIEKMEILRRNLFYIKRFEKRKKIERQDEAEGVIVEDKQKCERKRRVMKPNVFYDWDNKIIKKMSDENFMEFWNCTEGFLTPVYPLSITPCSSCRKKNTNNCSFLLPLHHRVCENEKCLHFGEPILPMDEVRTRYLIENLPIIFVEEDIPDLTQCDAIPDSAQQKICADDDINDIKCSIEDLNTKIQELQSKIKVDTAIIQSLTRDNNAQ